MADVVSEKPPLTRAVEQLQHLGLKPYEAKCFASLAIRSPGTARDISEHVDVPRTRIYEAVRVLEKQGLVEVQHSSSQQFRAIPIDEAVEILRNRYETRIESIADALDELDSDATAGDQDEHVDQEIWSLSDTAAIRTRTQELIRAADTTIALIIGSAEVLTDDLREALQDASDRGVAVVIGAVSAALTGQLQSALPNATVFESEVYWLQGSDTDDTAVGRILLVDDTTILASTIFTHDDSRDEQAIYGTGFGNSIVVIARRLLATGSEAKPLSSE